MLLLGPARAPDGRPVLEVKVASDEVAKNRRLLDVVRQLRLEVLQMANGRQSECSAQCRKN